MPANQPQQYKTIGIIGGVGPIATADFFQKLLRHVHASKDQEYPRVLIDSDSRIPDRTAAILGTGEDPTQQLIAVGHNLARAGAEVLCIPCNTAHAFFDRVQSFLNTPIVNMVEEVANAIQKKYPGARRVGILATTGTRAAKIYDQALESRGLTAVHVSEVIQEMYVMEAIYGREGIKAGGMSVPKQLLEKAIRELERAGADVVVLACTELPIVLQEASLPLIDSNAVLADAVLARARCGLEQEQEAFGRVHSIA